LANQFDKKDNCVYLLLNVNIMDTFLLAEQIDKKDNCVYLLLHVNCMDTFHWLIKLTRKITVFTFCFTWILWIRSIG